MRDALAYKQGYMARKNNQPIDACPVSFTTIGSDDRLITVSLERRTQLIHWWKGGWNDRDMGF